MIAVRVVQVSIDQIVDMVAMWHRFMTATGTVPMSRIMSAAAVLQRAAIRIRCTHFDDMFIDVIFMRMMEMAIVKIIDVTPMSNGNLTTAWSMDVRMIGVNRMVISGHGLSFPEA
jgi:hypothetical protein